MQPRAIAKATVADERQQVLGTGKYENLDFTEE